MRKRGKKRGSRWKLPSIPFARIWTWIRGRVANNRDVLRTGGKHVAILGAFVLVVLLIHHKLLSVLKSQESYAIDSDVGTAAVDVKPEWADSSGETPASESVVGNIDSTLDDELVGTIGRAFESNPWIKRVTSVERKYPDRIKVRFEFREPRFAVRTNGGYVLVDEEFVRLPGLYAEIPEPIRAPVVRGFHGSPPKAGTVWADPSIRAGGQMASLCQDRDALRSLDVEVVEVADRAGAIVLYTKSGSFIRWGRAPLMSDHMEISVDDKVDNLRRILVRYPGLKGVQSVTLFGGEPVVNWRDSSSARGR